MGPPVAQVALVTAAVQVEDADDALLGVVDDRCGVPGTRSPVSDIQLA